MQEEYDALLANQSWSLTSLPTSRYVVRYKWIFCIKENSDGIINCYKSRLVAKGFH